MAIARVRFATEYGGSGLAIAEALMTNTGGSLLVAFVEWEDVVTTVTMADTLNGSWTMLTHKTDAAPKGVIGYRENVAGGTNTITATFGASVPFCNMLIVEYSGVATSSAFDVEAVGSSGGGSGTALSTANAVTTTTGLIFVGMAAYSSLTYTPGTSNGQTYVEIEDNAGNPTSIEELLNVASGTYAGASTASTSSNWVMCLAAFKPAAGGGGGHAADQPLPLTGVQ